MRHGRRYVTRQSPHKQSPGGVRGSEPRRCGSRAYALLTGVGSRRDFLNPRMAREEVATVRNSRLSPSFRPARVPLDRDPKRRQVRPGGSAVLPLGPESQVRKVQREVDADRERRSRAEGSLDATRCRSQGPRSGVACVPGGGVGGPGLRCPDVLRGSDPVAAACARPPCRGGWAAQDRAQRKGPRRLGRTVLNHPGVLVPEERRQSSGSGEHGCGPAGSWGTVSPGHGRVQPVRDGEGQSRSQTAFPRGPAAPSLAFSSAGQRDGPT